MAQTITSAVAERTATRTPEVGPTTVLVIGEGQTWWDDRQLAALKQLGIDEATNADLAVFLHYCQRTGLDPFSRQIYMIKRRERRGNDWIAKQTIQVGIDGFRVIARRAATKAGDTIEYEDTMWSDAEGNWTDVWLASTPPFAAKVTVLRNGFRYPGVCRFDSYAAKGSGGDLQGQWRSQPDHMIEKCAEAYALRRAFPLDLAGIYAEEEMPPVPDAMQADKPQRVKAEVIKEKPAPAENPVHLNVMAQFQRLNVEPDDRAGVATVILDHPVGEYDKLPDDEAEFLLGELESCPDAAGLDILLKERRDAQ